MEMFELDWVFRLLAAMCAGIIIGYERHYRAKDAGIHTHTMVALGSCLLILISKYGFRDIGTGDPARVAAQVVSGIGFLGAGVIFVRHDIVQGLTTAAGIWAISAIGLCFGSGMYLIGLISTVLMVVVQHFFRLFLPHNSTSVTLKLKIRVKPGCSVRELSHIIRKSQFHLNGENRIVKDKDGGWYVSLDVGTSQNISPDKLLADLNNSDEIISAELQ